MIILGLQLARPRFHGVSTNFILKSDQFGAPALLRASRGLLKAPGGLFKAPGGLLKAPGSFQRAPEGLFRAPAGLLKAPGGLLKAPEDPDFIDFQLT